MTKESYVYYSEKPENYLKKARLFYCISDVFFI